MADNPVQPDVVMIEDGDESRRAQEIEDQRRNKAPRLANGVHQETADETAGDTGVASSSSGAQVTLSLATRSGIPTNGAGGTIVPTAAGAGGTIVPTAAVMGPGVGQALHPFGVSQNGLHTLAATQVTAPIVSGYSGAASTLLSPQPIGSPVDQLQVMSPNPNGGEHGHMLQEQR